LWNDFIYIHGGVNVAPVFISVCQHLPNRRGARNKRQDGAKTRQFTFTTSRRNARRSSFILISPFGLVSDNVQNLYGAPASYLAFAGRMFTAPIAGSDHGHGLLPKKAGFEVRYIEFGIGNPPGVLCQCCEFVTKS
jgi:hypothetical protein